MIRRFRIWKLLKSGEIIDFEVIGQIKARNVPGVHSYSFNDVNPFRELSYYRIRQVDFDGLFDRNVGIGKHRHGPTEHVTVVGLVVF